VSGQKSKGVSTAEFVRKGAACTVNRQEAHEHEQ
jgi:hypothetical protein